MTWCSSAPSWRGRWTRRRAQRGVVRLGAGCEQQGSWRRAAALGAGAARGGPLLEQTVEAARWFLQGVDKVFDTMEAARAAIEEATPLLQQAVKLSDEVSTACRRRRRRCCRVSAAALPQPCTCSCCRRRRCRRRCRCCSCRADIALHCPCTCTRSADPSPALTLQILPLHSHSLCRSCPC